MAQNRRAAPGGRGLSSRGRGGRARGRGSGRGRGGRGRARFNTQRLAEQDANDSESVASRESDLGEESLSELESEEESRSQAKPYMALLNSFSESSMPNAKRRKLSHREEPEPNRAEADEEDEEDEDEPRDVDFIAHEGDAISDGEEEILGSTLYDDDEDPSDPFDSHFSTPDEVTIWSKINAIQQNQWELKRAIFGRSRVVSMYPGNDNSIEITPPSSLTDSTSIKLKQRLKPMPKFDDVQSRLAPMVFNYQDVFYCQRTVDNSESLRNLVCLHALNHILKTRDRILKNNAKLSKDGEDSELELRDQGFTRPKVLFLLPTRQSCAKVVSSLMKLCGPEQQENRKRFEDTYIQKDPSFGKDKPADFKELFEGNDDDMFRLGLMFTRKTVKYFAPFYRSDIIFASPLGLRMAIGSEEEKEKKMDFDFLSSIELVIVDQADALLMQNWEHVEFIFDHLNLHPREARDYDIGRVRNWYLENVSKHYRQTIVMSAYNTPELSELMRTYCLNWAGKFRLQPEYSGEIQRLGIKVKQTFSRFDSPSVDKDPDSRFSYFSAAIVPYLAKRAKELTGVLIFIPSYLDFVRVRNFFATSPALASVTFGTISEYTDVPEASRARSHFVTGRHRVLLYTERAHHFRRNQIKGVKSIIMYALPENPSFYLEIAGGYLAKSAQDMTLAAGQGSVRVMFSKYDAMKLERVAGSQRVGKMLSERGDTFDFL